MDSANLCAVIFVILCTIPKSSCNEATVGANFQYSIEKEGFFGHSSLGLDQRGPIVYTPYIVGKPGLPKWLRYLQPAAPSYQGYMYGTPGVDNIGDITIEIIALNTNTYQSARVKVPISITSHVESPVYLATFLLTNYDVLDMLHDNRLQEDFLKSIGIVWSSTTPWVIHRLASAPSPTGPPGKEGVYITVGSTTPISPELLTTNLDAQTSCPNGTFVPFKLNMAFEPEFVVDWCQLTLTQTDISKSSPITLGDEYMPPAMTSTPASHQIEFLLIVVPPLVVALIFVIVLGCLMCGGREGRKRISRTPEIQLTHHQGLRNASCQLRALSNCRDNSPVSSPTTPIIPHGVRPAVNSVTSSPVHRIRDPDELRIMASTPLFAHTSPPPYRSTSSRHQSTPQETSFNGPFDSRRLSEPGQPRGHASPSLNSSPPPFMSGPYSSGYPVGGSSS